MPEMPPTALQVALPVPLPVLYDYLPCPGMQADPGWVGCRVLVQFGRRELVGVVAGCGPAGLAAEALRPVMSRLDATPLLEGELLETLRWAARYYHEPLGQVLQAALPLALRGGEPLPETAVPVWHLTEAGRTAVDGLRAGSRPRQLAERLRQGPADEDALEAAQPGWRTAARSLLARGLAERRLEVMPAATPLATGRHPLNPPQQAAADAVGEAMGGFRPFLLEGVTGSGKTEVYLEAIADCLRRGRQALVLVPEIGLTPQTLRRFRERLGVPVHALHSGLADGERARTWTAMARGEARVLVGTRSAIFCPLPAAGLIVVDEEHDASYKQQEGFRYSARDLALVRARALGVPVLLGSATPSLESLHHALGGRYVHLRLRERAGSARPPAVRVLDIRKRSLQAGMSPELLDAIGRSLQAGGQVLVFRNRRGYAPVLLCHDCGWSAQCRRCDAPMTVHGRGRRLICHHCGARATPPPACPACASLGLQAQGAGTERIEDVLAERFPDVPLVRVDRETTRRRDALQHHLDTLGDRPGILVGTQMLAKGHDLPGLSLVCVVGVDEGLFSADFRAPERLAQLLLQVAGRAGRADTPGEVLLQTHHPEHPLLTTLLAGGYPAFAAIELGEREAAGFPPHAHLALLRAEAPLEGTVQAFLMAARVAMERQAGQARTAVELLGPLPAPMARRAGRARGQLLLSSAQRPALQALLGATVPELHALPEARRVRWSLDVDPVDLY